MRGVKSLVPNLRFPEFRDSGEWDENSLIQLAKFRRGSFPQPYGLPEWYDNENGMPFIQVFDVSDNLLLKPTTKRKISKLAAEQSVFISKETLIVTLQGSIGRVAVTQYDAYIDRTLLIFEEYYKPVEKLFFAYVIQNLFEIEKEKAPGGIIKTITKEVLSNFIVKLPKFPEQKKIADCLSSIDQLITAHSQKHEALKAHKKGLMQQLFPTEGETVPKLRFPEFRDAGEWKSKQLTNICNMQAGKFVRAADINEQKNSDLYSCYGGNGLRGFTKTFTHAGKYSLIGRQGALCGNVRLATGKFHATEHAVVVTPQEGVDTDWLFYKLAHLNLNQYATGQAQPGLSVDNLEKIAAEVPKTKKEQQKIADCLSSLDDLITAQSQKIESLKTHKKGLMQQLFPTADDDCMDAGGRATQDAKAEVNE